VRDGEEPREDELSVDELEGHDVAELPDREAMSVIGDVTIPLDPDMAADALLGQDAPDEPEDPPTG
jgi:hypothetical protein